MNIKKVGVLGCGLMGSGIAQVAATRFRRYRARTGTEISRQGFAASRSRCREWWNAVRQGGLTAEQKTEAQSHLKGTLKIQDLADCDIVIEAIIENVELSARPTPTRGHRQERRDLRHQHFVHLCYRADDGDQAPRLMACTSLIPCP